MSFLAPDRRRRATFIGHNVCRVGRIQSGTVLNCYISTLCSYSIILLSVLFYYAIVMLVCY